MFIHMEGFLDLICASDVILPTDDFGILYRNSVAFSEDRFPNGRGVGPLCVEMFLKPFTNWDLMELIGWWFMLMP